jgi:hypothetical protein
MFRRTYQRFGAGFAQRGILGDPEDVFYLEHDEIVSAVRQPELARSFGELVQKRKQDYAGLKSITLPSLIYGEAPPPIVEDTSATLWGIPASRGVHRGVVRVAKGISDLSKVVNDCVLPGQLPGHGEGSCPGCRVSSFPHRLASGFRGSGRRTRRLQLAAVSQVPRGVWSFGYVGCIVGDRAVHRDFGTLTSDQACGRLRARGRRRTRGA